MDNNYKTQKQCTKNCGSFLWAVQFFTVRLKFFSFDFFLLMLLFKLTVTIQCFGLFGEVAIPAHNAMHAGNVIYGGLS